MAPQTVDEGQDDRAFEILNLGKYQRQYYIGVNLDPARVRADDNHHLATCGR